jgi:hypothetical protein
MFCIMFAQSFELITMYLSTDPLLGADEASGLSWQLVTTICDEADGLTLCVSDSHKVMTALVVMLLSNVCCGDFSAISYICICLINDGCLMQT